MALQDPVSAETADVPRFDAKYLDVEVTKVMWETLPGGKKRPLVPGFYYAWPKADSTGILRNEYYMYAGPFKNVNEVPAHRCAYTIGSYLIHRNRKEAPMDAPKSHKKREDNSRPLNVEIKSEDNELMVLIKEVLRGTTVAEFKSLFDNVTEMNNMRRAIEYGDQGNLSWNRFKDMLERLAVEYTLELRKPEK